MNNEEIIEVIVLACLLGGSGLAAAFIWGKGVTLLPRQRRRAVPWDIAEVAFAFVLLIFTPPFTLGLLVNLGAFPHLQGMDLPALRDNREALNRCLPLAILVAMPIQVAGILLISFLSSRTQPYQLGLTTHRLKRDLALGGLTWLVVTPIILLLNGIILLIYTSLGRLPEKHMVEELAGQMDTPLQWLQLAMVAVVAAPVVEELVFRGVLQPWTMKRPVGADLALAGSGGVMLLSRHDKLLEALRPFQLDWLLTELEPFFFLALAAAPYVLLRRRGATAACAIYATSVLFASFHAEVWPSPIPLLPLGMVLGWLAYRTQSLTASITLHMLFNSVAVVVLLATQLTKGNDETIAPAPASVSSRVPGS